MNVVVFETPEDVAAGAADRITASLGSLGDATLALAGGGTPRMTHRRLVDAAIDWTRVTIWLADERWVPSDHQDSNERMVRETLVDEVGGRLVAPDHSIGDPVATAAAYAEALSDLWIEREGARAPDIVMLGIGDDGHTASLFPGTAALEIVDRPYVANRVEQKDTWRLTATLPLLWSAREIVFLVTGAAKASVLARIIEGEEPLPSQRVAAGARNAVWLVDAAAASRLRSHHR